MKNLIKSGLQYLLSLIDQPVIFKKQQDAVPLARKLFVVDYVGKGKPATYEKNVDVTATVLASNNLPIESRVFGDRIIVPTNTICSNPTIKHSEDQRRSYDIRANAIESAKQEVRMAEDAYALAAIDSSASIENTVQDIGDFGVQLRDLIAIKKQVEVWGNPLDSFVMNQNEWNNILAWGSGGGSGSVLKLTNEKIRNTQGIYGYIWGVKIYVSTVVPSGTVYGLAAPKFVGAMPIAKDINVKEDNTERQLKYAVIVSEDVGFAVLNPRGVAAGKKCGVQKELKSI